MTPVTMGAKRILLLVFGSLLALLGLAAAIGGGTALVAYGTGRDSDGYFTTSTQRFQTVSRALVSEEVDLGSESDAAGPVSLGDLANVRVRAEGAGGRAVFVGIGPRSQVTAYLDGVAYDEVTNVDYDPFKATYAAHRGLRTPAPPAQQDFWAARASGPGQQTLNWDLQGGTWSLVVMNADAVAGRGRRPSARGEDQDPASVRDRPAGGRADRARHRRDDDRLRRAWRRRRSPAGDGCAAPGAEARVAVLSSAPPQEPGAPSRR